jgi:hypothetical protein
MAERYVIVPLYEDPFYSYAISLEGESYILEFQYNERAELYFLSIYTADREPVVLGVGVVPYYPITLDYILPGLSGYFWLEEKATYNSEPYKEYPDKIHEYYNAYYIYSSEG